MTGLIPPVLVDNVYRDAPLPELNGDGRYLDARLLTCLHAYVTASPCCYRGYLAPWPGARG